MKTPSRLSAWCFVVRDARNLRTPQAPKLWKKKEPVTVKISLKAPSGKRTNPSRKRSFPKTLFKPAVAIEEIMVDRVNKKCEYCLIFTQTIVKPGAACAVTIWFWFHFHKVSANRSLLIINLERRYKGKGSLVKRTTWKHHVPFSICSLSSTNLLFLWLVLSWYYKLYVCVTYHTNTLTCFPASLFSHFSVRCWAAVFGCHLTFLPACWSKKAFSKC